MSKRSNVSWSQPIEQRLQEIMRARGFSSVSDCLQTLIREEYERRHPPALHDQPAPATAHPTQEHPVTYPASKSSSKKSQPSESTAKAVVAIVKKHAPAPKAH